MRLKSPEFKDSQFIPAKFSCEGEDVNPELMIGDIPPEAKSLALIVDDPDAPMGTWVHWVVFDIPPIPGIAENSIPGIQGINSAGGKNYHGPCPPSGAYRYLFKIYALDTVLNLKAGISKEQLEKAMQGHILASAQLLGLYKKSS
ncbi:MAG: YbhB/YbcL family Raf kinase inhibitor-like protein [Candidatus Omnitrophota bacterium]